MDHPILKALRVVLTSLSIALAFNILFFEKEIGISIFIIALILMGAVSLLAWREQLSMRKTWWLILLITFFALMPSIHANELLTFLNSCAAFGLLMLLAHELVGTPAFLMKLRDYFLLIILGPFQMVGRAVYALTLLGKFQSNVEHSDTWLRVLKGTIMAVPILIVFGLLFSQADLAFSQFVTSFVDINISERTIEYFILLFIAFMAALGFLSYIFFPKTVETKSVPEQSATTAQSAKGIEVMVFLGLISSLFIIFIGFQLTYLFGGEANIINAGFTYAEYARRGFWELLAAAMLSLVVLLAAEKYAGVETKSDKRFLIPALILIAEVGIIIVSTFKRLSLYVDAYGLTTQRFYAAGFILLLSVLFILLLIKFIKSKPEQFFAFGALLSLTTFLITINFVNPDAFIARSNFERYNRMSKIDHLYIGELSADAVFWKIELYKKMAGEDKLALRAELQKQKDYLQKSAVDWQSANLSRSRALQMLQTLGE